MRRALLVLALLGPAAPAWGHWTSLWNGRDLEGWTVLLVGRAPGEDPAGVFRVTSVDGRPALRVSGAEWGGVVTETSFEDYHLQLAFRWGEERHGPRATAARDSGLLYHAQGEPAPATGWLESVEFGILEGGETGDFWSVPGRHGVRIHVDVEGVEIPPAERRYPDQPIRYRPGGARFAATRAAILSARDHERPRGRWNRLDLYCLGQTAIHVVNGRVALVLTNIQRKTERGFVPLTAGKLQIQSEGAEVFFRDIRLRPLRALPAPLARYVPEGAAARPNTLTERERRAGWRLLFDGHGLAGWRALDGAAVPPGWQAEHGALVLAQAGGDLMTAEAFDTFELSLEFRLPEGGNSGIFYLVDPDRRPVHRSAFEYELRDDRAWPEDPYKTGAAYGLQAPPEGPVLPPGAWNHARILVQADRVEHWLNGKKVVAFDRRGPGWERLRAASKFRDEPRFGRALRGHILLQDHGSPVAFRNVKIRPLPGRSAR